MNSNQIRICYIFKKNLVEFNFIRILIFLNFFKIRGIDISEFVIPLIFH